MPERPSAKMKAAHLKVAATNDKASATTTLFQRRRAAAERTLSAKTKAAHAMCAGLPRAAIRDTIRLHDFELNVL
jgi:hypothetical protein